MPPDAVLTSSFSCQQKNRHSRPSNESLPSAEQTAKYSKFARVCSVGYWVSSWRSIVPRISIGYESLCTDRTDIFGRVWKPAQIVPRRSVGYVFSTFGVANSLMVPRL